MRGNSVSLVIPVYNSEATIGGLVERLQALLGGKVAFDVVLVNDGSRDGSSGILRGLHARYGNVSVIELSRNFGQHNALMAGMRYARGDYVVTLDDDLQHPPEDVLRLIEEIDKGYDVVYGMYRSKRHSLLKNLGSEVNNLMAGAMLNKPGWLRFTSFRILRSYVVQEMAGYRGPYSYIDGLVLRVTRNVGAIVIDHRARASGRSNYTFKKLFGLWMNGFLNFSILPLRLFTFLGFAFAGLGFAAALAILALAVLFYIPVQGWASLIVATLIFSGAMLMSVGMVGEYVGRIFMITNGMPQFVVREALLPDPEKGGRRLGVKDGDAQRHDENARHPVPVQRLL